MWHFVYSSKQRCREEFTWLYTMRANPRATSIWRQHTASGRWLRDIAPDVLHAICHAPIFYPVLHPGCKTLYLFIPFICYSGDESQQRSFHMHSNDTETQNWQARRLEHRFSFRHLLLAARPPPPNPSFLGNVQQFQIRLSHQFLPVKGKRIKKKKGGGRRKAVKMMISPSSSWGLSYAICFDIPPHQLLYLTILRGEEHKKKACRLARIWWQVPIQSLNINGGKRETEAERKRERERGLGADNHICCT